METSIPFSGFYNSWHDSELDTALDRMFDDSRGEPIEPIVSKVYDLIDWQAVHIDYAKSYVTAFAKEFEITLKFQELSSPKFYNFETDRIFCTIPMSEIRRLFKKTDTELLKEKIRERFTSYDGFHSFYPNTLDEWPKDLAKWDANHVGTLIAAYIEQIDDEFDMESEINLFDYPYEMASNCFCGNMGNVAKYFKIANYLRTREERA